MIELLDEFFDFFGANLSVLAAGSKLHESSVEARVRVLETMSIKESL